MQNIMELLCTEQQANITNNSMLGVIENAITELRLLRLVKQGELTAEDATYIKQRCKHLRLVVKTLERL